MDPEKLKKLLEDVRGGEVGVDSALEKLRQLPYEDLGFARVDHHRALRRGFPEVVLGEGKTIEQIIAVLKSLRRAGSSAVVTRLDPEKAQKVTAAVKGARHEAAARAVVACKRPIPNKGRGTVIVVTAGTSDIPVAEESAITLEVMGNRVDRLYDVGVAGLHRLFGERDRLESATVIIVVAGMEGALPSVIAGAISRPVIAVPTSIGYGASFGGIAALLGMLNSCAGGVAVVNIDNGFGAAFVASLINRA